jgi:hypothetical protein
LRDAVAIDLRSLAALRVALALIVLVDLGLRFQWLVPHYTDAGILPRYAVAPVSMLFPFYFLDGGPSLQMLLFGVAGVFASMLLVGFRTRLANVASWLLLCSLQVRNDSLLNGGDIALRLLLMWSLFLPLGARFSLDSLRRPRPAADARVADSSVASVALLLQIVLIYMFAGFGKIDPEWVSEGIAIERVMNGDYARQPVQGLLLSSPGLMRLLTLTVVPFETLGPLLLLVTYRLPRCRVAVVFAFICFQAGLGSSMDLHLFPFAMTAGILPFLPTAFWEWIDTRRGAPREAPAAGGAAERLPAASRLGTFVVQPIVCVLLVYTVFANFRSSGWVEVPRALVGYAQVIGLRQGWHLYAPHPPLWEPDWRTYGLLENGRALDLYTGRFGRAIGPVHGSHRMRRYLDTKVRPPKGGRDVALYADWLCRLWNADPHREADLEHVRLLFMQRWTLEPAGPVDRPYLLLEHECGTRV